MALDPLRTRLCEDLGIEFPIIAFSHCKDVIAAVSNAGGLAVFGAGSLTPGELDRDIRWIREHVGSRPFGVDVMVPASVPPSGNMEELEQQIPQAYWEFVNRVKRENSIPPPKPKSPEEQQRRRAVRTQEIARAQLDVVLEERVPVFASGLGSPAFVLQEAHARGIKVIGLIGNTRQARREAEAGVDYIVAQGYDAGGHTGDIGTFSLVPQVVDAVRPTPVICAGGVGSGRHLAASLCLGAVGVWSGTIWLTARESDTDIIIKQKILEATERDTVRSRSGTGKPVRQLRTKWTEAWEQPGALQPLPMPLQGILAAEVLEAARDHKIVDFMGSPAGQVVGMIHEMKPAAQIVFDIVDEARTILDGLAGVEVTG
ncbi:MAG: nitronate monooxygenase [Chloroflexi bacterium]|nr:nitronate monooxygenase [Chloroflexota bacterium]